MITSATAFLYPRLCFSLVAFGLLLLVAPLRAGQSYAVTSAADDGSEGTLRWAITQANASSGSTITLADNLGTITLTSQAPLITAAVTINGGTGNTVSGGDTWRPFFVDAGTGSAVVISNLTVAHGYAKGGDGGERAGGGMGAGGALFVNTGNVTLSNVSFASNVARGGAGGVGTGSNIGVFGGGGGGLGGNGGNSISLGTGTGINQGSGGGGGFGGNGGNGGGGGGGLIGSGGDGYFHGGGGGGGGLTDGSDGTASVGGAGGTNGGSGGLTVSGGTYSVGGSGALYGGGGGSGHAGINATRAYGGTGGKYGGGGGVYSSQGNANLGSGAIAGNGGDFGGGGGGRSSFSTNALGTAGNGGYGGGGGGGVADNAKITGETVTPGKGGFGGGDGVSGSGTGGGGSAYGGNVFVRGGTGATITYAGTMSDPDGSLTAGTGGVAGKASGTNLFIHDGGAIFSVPSGTQIVSGSIGGNALAVVGGPASMTAVALSKTGAGTLVLQGANTLLGTTSVKAGTLQIGDGGTAGSIVGDVQFAGGTVVFNRSDRTVYAGLFWYNSGVDHTVTQAGSGTLVITAVQDTTLRVAPDYAVTAGTLEFQYASSDRNNGNIANGGTVVFDGGFYNGLMSGTGAVSIAGTVVYTAANTYSGNTTVAGGTLAISAAQALQNSTLVFNGGSISFGTGSFVLGGLAGTADLSLAGKLVSVGQNGADTRYSGILSNGTLAKTGAGTLTLANTNTYAGGTTLSAGTLALESDGALGSGTLTVTAGALQAAGSGTRTVTNDIALNGDLSLSGALTLSGTISGTGHGLTVTGNTTLSGANTYSGPTTLSDGGLQIAHALALQNSTLMTNASGGTVSFGAISSATLGGLSGSGNLSLGGVALNVGNNSSDTTYSGALSGGSLTKSGTGTLTLSGTNTHTGTQVNGGTLAVNSVAALGSGTLGLDGGTLRNTANLILARGATLGAGGGTLDASGGFFTLNGNLTGPGGLTKTGPKILTLSGAHTYTGATTVSAGTLKFTANGATASTLATSGIGIAGGAMVIFADSQTYAGTVTGAGVLEHEFGGTTILTGAATHTGGTNIIGGTIQVGNGSTTGSLGGNVVLSGGGTLIFNRGDDVTFSGAVSGTGTVVQSGAGTLTAGSATAFGAVPLLVTAGRLDLNGFAVGNTLDVQGGSVIGAAHYAGTSTIKGAANFNGTIGGTNLVTSSGILNTTGALFTGPTTVQSGGRLGGTGTVADLTIQAGGTLAPGNSPGLLTVSGDLALAGTTELQLAGLDRGTTYDAIDVGGSLTLGGTLHLTLLDGFTPASGNSFDLLHYTVSTFSGTFAAIDLPALTPGLQWDTNALYTAGTLSVSGSPVPEPAACAALAGLGALALVLKRRRQRM